MTPKASLRLPAPLLGLAGALALLLPGTALAKPPIWIVRDADSTILLFGSVHMLPKGVDWTPPALTDALANRRKWGSCLKQEAANACAICAEAESGLMSDAFLSGSGDGTTMQADAYQLSRTP